MAFIVEDGTGVANSNAYCPLSFADSYFDDRQNFVWAVADDDAKKAAIIRASDYIEIRFGAKFIGVKVDSAQSLSWPRQSEAQGYVYPYGIALYAPDTSFPTGIVPQCVQRACAEYALRALSAPLAPDPVMDATGRAVQSTSDKVGPIESSVTYVPSAVPATFIPYPAADKMLAPVLSASSGGVIRS